MFLPLQSKQKNILPPSSPQRCTARKTLHSYLTQVKRQLSTGEVKGVGQGQKWEEEEDLNEDRPLIAAPSEGPRGPTHRGGRAVPAGRPRAAAGLRDGAPPALPKPAARKRTSQWEARVKSSRESRHRLRRLHAQGGVLAGAIFSPPGRSSSRFPGPPPQCPRRSQRGSHSPGREGRPAGRPRHGPNGVALSPRPCRPFPHGGRCGSRRRLLC